MKFRCRFRPSSSSVFEGLSEKNKDFFWTKWVVEQKKSLCKVMFENDYFNFKLLLKQAD